MEACWLIFQPALKSTAGMVTLQPQVDEVGMKKLAVFESTLREKSPGKHVMCFLVIQMDHPSRDGRKMSSEI